MDVQLYVYDLSQGLARQFSQQFIGTQIDAVYHTSIVLEGIEYFYGAGIQSTQAGSTHHGRPMETVSLGRTELPIELVLEYLDSLRSIYTQESYDLFLHNCNNFSNDFAMFLVGKNIPIHITSLPQTVMNTPFGMMLKPYLDQAMRPITQAPVQSTIPSQPSATRSTDSGAVRNITSISELEKALASAKNSCSIIFFTSSTCGPCKILYGPFDQAARETGDRAVFIKVDINLAQAIAEQYRISATPTFMTFLKGAKQEQWAGADLQRLQSSLKYLLAAAYPAHPHTSLPVSALVAAGRTPIRYTKLPPLDKLIPKLGSLATDPSVLAMKTFLPNISSANAADNPLPSLPDFATFLTHALSALPNDALFAAYDLFRAALIDARVAAFFADSARHTTLLTLLHYVTDADTEAPYPLRIVALHLACNVLAGALPHSLEQSVLAALVSLAAAGLLDAEHANVRVAAASLAFNLSSLAQRGAIALSDDSRVELVAATAEALGRETESVECATGLVLALGLAIYMADMDGEVVDLCRAIDVAGTVKSKKELLQKTAASQEAVMLVTKGLERS
ncbi:putative thioredoxin [Microthyrium microscopicum]|uniref:Putative thioredoxin n=1 Tax=Microthyrium microscopicum TaxID=703497 RepID=A0A6A6U3R5_9PEZI|nr:putative thioredoxin [Microthyrium microscopicum]